MGEITDIHGAAAKISNKNANRLNGFDYWFVIRDNQKYQSKKLEKTIEDVLGF